MKRAYTQFKIEHLSDIRAGITSKQYELAAKAAMSKIPDIEFIQGLSIEICTYWMDERIYNQEAEHWFLNDEQFCKWLETCADNTTPNHIFPLLTNGVSAKNILANWRSEDFYIKIICLHFPTSSHRRSTSVTVAKVLGKQDEFQFIEHPSYDKRAPYDWFRTPFTIDGKFDDSEVTRQTNLRLFLGVCLYISAFPETIINGLPSDLKHPSHHHHKDAFTIGISDKVKLGGTHDSPTPHFRVGHFRVLQSEKFTNKRFQTVFVHETFVRGVAKTVLSPEQVSDTVGSNWPTAANMTRLKGSDHCAGRGIQPPSLDIKPRP